MVVGHARLGADPGGGGDRDDVEGGRVGAPEGVGQRVAVGVGCGQGGADVPARGRVLGQAAGRGCRGERRRAVDEHFGGHLQDIREPVHGAVGAGHLAYPAAEGAVLRIAAAERAETHHGVSAIRIA